MSYYIGQVVRGKVWSGNDYGFQLPATYKRLKEQGAFKKGAKQLNRISKSLQRFYEKNAPQKVKDAVKWYSEASERENQRYLDRGFSQDQIDKANAEKQAMTMTGQGTERLIQSVSDKTNIAPQIIGGAVTLAQTAIEGKLSAGAVKRVGQSRLRDKIAKRGTVKKGEKVFHGTSDQVAPAITKGGFKPSGKTTGVFGEGVYMTPNDYYASMYAEEAAAMAKNVEAKGVLFYGDVPGGHRILDVSDTNLNPRALERKLGIKDLSKWVKSKGYDGVKFKPVSEAGGTNEVLIFNPKLADQVFGTGIHSKGEPFPSQGTPIKARPNPVGSGDVPTRQSQAKGTQSRIQQRLQARSVGAAGNPNIRRIEHPDEGIEAVLKANQQRPPQAREVATPKTAGRSASGIGAKVDKTKTGNYIVRGEHNNVTFKPEIGETDAQLRNRAENFARGLDYIQSNTQSMPKRLKLPLNKEGIATRPNTNQFTGRLTEKEGDMIVTPSNRIKSKLQRKRATEAAQAAKRADAKSDIPSAPADAPVGGTAKAPTGTGVFLGANRPEVPRRIGKRLAKRELEYLDAEAAKKGKKIVIADEMVDGVLNPFTPIEVDKGVRANGILPQQSLRRIYQSRIERERFSAQAAARSKFADKSLKHQDEVHHLLGRSAKKRQSIKDRIQARRDKQLGRELVDTELGLYVDRPADAKHAKDVPQLGKPKTGRRASQRREMTSENAEAQRRRTEADIAANPLRREGREGAAKVKTLPGRDPFKGDSGERMKQVMDEIWNEKLRDFRGNTTELSEWWKRNDDLIDDMMEDRFRAPQAAIKWYNRFKRKDIETGNVVPTDAIPDRAKSRIKERLRKGAEPTDAEKRLRSKLQKEDNLIPDFNKAGNSKKIAELNKDFVQALEMSGELTLNDAGELVRRRQRIRRGAEGRQNLSGARFNEDEFRFSDVDKTGGKPGREGGRNLNRDIRNRLRTLDYEEFFEEFYPRSKYPADMSAAEVHRQRNIDFANDFPETARLLGGNLKTDNPAGRKSVRNQFREARERDGIDGLPKNVEDLRRSDSRTRTESIDTNKAGQLLRPDAAIKRGKPSGRQPKPDSRLIDKGRSQRRTTDRTVPVADTVLDTGSGLTQPVPQRRRSRIQRRLDSMRSRIKEPQKQAEKLQEAKAKTAVKKDRLRRQLERYRNRKR